jgi:hypothetical protein
MGGRTSEQQPPTSSVGAAAATDSVVFSTGKPAPTGFTRWTVYWVHPNVAESAKVGIEIRSGKGEVYYRFGPETLSSSSSFRSNFMKCATDVGKLYGDDVVFKFWTTKGKITFPADFVPMFEFYRKGHTIATITGIRQN